MKYTFLLLGANDGNVIKKLNTLNIFDTYNEDIIWDEIHLFEPNPRFSSDLEKIESVDSKIIYHNEAADLKDSISKFYIKGAKDISSTLDENKTTGEGGKVIDVKTINFIDWLEKNTKENDFIVIDMDIECGEYKILPKLMESQVSNRIKYISVEFHSGKSSYWSQNNLDLQIEEQTKTFFQHRFLDHNKYFG
jgi:FkbM family methyltransferase